MASLTTGFKLIKNEFNDDRWRINGAKALKNRCFFQAFMQNRCRIIVIVVRSFIIVVFVYMQNFRRIVAKSPQNCRKSPQNRRKSPQNR